MPPSPGSVEAHLAGILAATRPLPAETVATVQARGRTLAADARAEVALPAFDNSAMDGFAVRFADVAHASADAPAHLRVVADLPAGSADDPPLAPGEAIRIMTGAPLPSAADTVVPFEQTAGGLADSLGEIAVLAPPRGAGAHVRRAGEDARLGDVVVPGGTVLGPLQLGALMSTGVGRVVVTRRPRVAVVSTGTELVAVGAPLQRGQIPESNGTLLAELVTAAGAEVAHRAVIVDEPALLAAHVAALTDGEAAVDAIVFTGGVSAGAYEVVRSTLTDMSFRSVAMQPGRPQGFGIRGRTLLFGLPGNPVSAAVSFEAFVRPALLTLLGRADVQRAPLRLTAAVGWPARADRQQFVAVTIDRRDPARWSVTPVSRGGSHLARSLGRADGYAIVPEGVDGVEQGDAVDVVLVDGPGMP